MKIKITPSDWKNDKKNNKIKCNRDKVLYLKKQRANAYIGNGCLVW